MATTKVAASTPSCNPPGSWQRGLLDYDALGRMTWRKDGLGAQEDWAYDVRGNRLSLDGRIPGSSDLVAWTYDAADRMLTRVADSVTTTYGYDDAGNLESASTSSPPGPSRCPTTASAG